MTFIELPEPVPRSQPLAWTREQAAVVSREFLVVPEKPEDISFWSVIESRRSRRLFGMLDRLTLSQLLWNAIKTRETLRPHSEMRWQTRPYPSAGGIYPVDVLLVEPGESGPRCAWYNAVSHSLDSPELSSPKEANLLFAAADEVVPVGNGIVLWFVANTKRPNAQYSNFESLVWRDSGALLMALYLVAEALKISCCGIGATGSQQIRSCLGLGNEYIGVGGCVIGSKVSDFSPV